MNTNSALADQVRSQYVSEDIAADALDQTIGTLRNWRSKGKGPDWVKIGRNVRYPANGILSFIEKSRCKAAS